MSDKPSEQTYLTAQSYLEKGDVDRAAELLEAFLRAHPEHVQAWLDITRIALLTGQYRATAQLALGILDEFPELAGAWFALGLALEKDQLERGIEALQRACLADQSFAPAQFHLARLLGKQGQLDDAIVHAEVALLLAPEDIDFLSLAARLYTDARAYKEAHEYWTRILKLDAQHLDAYLALSEIFTAEGEFDIALETLQEAHRCCGPSPRITAEEVSVHMLLGAHEKAVLAARRLIQRLPESAEAHLQLGTLLMQGGELSEAELILWRSHELNESDWRPLHLLGKIFEVAEVYEHAEEAFRHAVEAAPTHWKPLNDLGLLLLEQKRSDEAVAILTRAVQHAPHDETGPLYNLLLSFYQAGDIGATKKLADSLLSHPSLTDGQRTAVQQLHQSL
ncbi:MAG TPA: hypothetical protein DCE42_20430 [Myxococcales bacterium]|nr:hypothetical protein [Deltaproteobacteria bacterium]MBU50978.1 hypothetical protein [Deltaproteobacteria bacterium]HAA57144.1 hypothetical protein [Myxococcales bacterium]